MARRITRNESTPSRFVSISVGKNVRDNKPVQKHFTLEGFLRWLMKQTNPSGEAYVCAPMAGRRSKKNAKPTRVLYIDYDVLTDEQYRRLLRTVAKRYRGIAYTTRSHTSVHPRLRLVVLLVRPVGAEEYRHLYATVAAALSLKAVGDASAIKPDMQCADPEQAMFLPQEGSRRWNLKGKCLDPSAFRTAVVDLSDRLKSSDESKLIGDILDGRNLHESTLILTAKLAKRTGDAEFTARVVRSLMSESGAPRDARFKSRYKDVKRLADDALRRFGTPTQSQENDSILQKLESASIPLDWLRKKPPPVVYLVKDLIIVGTVVFLIADGGLGKSTLLLHGAVCIATGSPFLGREVEQGRVLYICHEDGPEDLRRRLWTIMHHELAERSIARKDFIRLILNNLAIVSLVGEQFHIIRIFEGQAVQSELIEDLIPLMADYDVVILDPLSRMHGADENSNSVATTLINTLERLAQTTGATVLVAHHTGKAAAASRNKTLYAARGASGFADAGRGMLRLVTVTEEDCKNYPDVDLEEVDDERILQLHVAKIQYGPKPKPLWLRRNGEDLELLQVEPVHWDLSVALQSLRTWYEEHDGKPLFRETIRNNYPKIFPGLSRARSVQMFSRAIDDGALVRAHAQAGNPRAKAYIFPEETRDTGRPPAASTAGQPKTGKGGPADRAAARSLPKAAADVGASKEKASVRVNFSRRPRKAGGSRRG